MNRTNASFLIGLAALAGIPSCLQGQLVIQFDYTYDTGSFFDAGRKAVLDKAAEVFTSRLTDTLDTISPSGGNTWTRTFTSPSSSSTINVNNPVIPANTLVIYVGAKDLGANVLGQGGPGGASASGTSGWADLIVTRGEAGITRQDGTLSGSNTDTDYAPWGGVISFTTRTGSDGATWYFDSDPASAGDLPGGSDDFYSVAVHEIAHVLGYGTAPSWDGRINGSNQFTGANSMTLHGGNVPLSGDAAHWNAGITSTLPGTSTSQETAMDPNIARGTRKYFTDLDYAGLQDIGWQVTPVPEPQAMLATAVCLLAVAGWRWRTKTGTSS